MTTGSFGVVDGRHVRLPRIGVIRTKEATTVPANALGEEKFMPAGRCSSRNCEDGTGPARPDKTATAAEQSTAA